jgi:hypothetical protein
LLRAEIPRAAMPPCVHLLHREEGIDLRLPPAARTQVLVEECRPQGQQCLNRLLLGRSR